MTDTNYSRTEKTLIMQDLQKYADPAGIIDARDLQLVADRVRITDDGYIYGAEKAVAELQKESPHLFRPQAPAKKGMIVVQKPNAGAGASSSDMTPAETLAANKASRVWRDALSGNGRM